MVYTLNQPDPGDQLSVSAPILRDNTNTANTYFGIDHFSFAAAANNGLHQQVTMLAQSHPVSPTGRALMYAAQDSTPIGVLDYSRGNNSGPPTPITLFQSSSTSPVTITGSPTTILDCTGLTLMVAIVSASSTSSAAFGMYYVTYNGSAFSTASFNVIEENTNDPLIVTGSSKALQLVSNGTSVGGVYWTINFLRINQVT